MCGSDRKVAGNGASTWVNMVLPLVSSMAMAGYMITFGRPLLIVIGIGFVLVSICTSVTMQVQALVKLDQFPQGRDRVRPAAQALPGSGPRP